MSEKKYLIMTPGPTNVPDRVIRAMIKPTISHRGPEFHALYESITENLKYAFQTKNDVFTLTSSGTGGVECAVSNIVNQNDQIIIPVFGVFSERLKEKVVLRGGKVIEVPINWGEAPTAEQIERIIDREKNVKALALVYNETSTGVTVRDLTKIARISKKKGILLIVDAVSVLGGDHLPVDELGVDICVAGSQKCLACPPGLAVISVGERAWRAIEKTSAKPYYYDLLKFREFGEKKETPVTPAVPLFYAIDEALKLLREEGLENRINRHKTCAKAFYKAAEGLFLKTNSKENIRSNTVISINLPANIDSSEIQKMLRERHRVVIATGMGKFKKSALRIGCMGIISEIETLSTINALESALIELKHPIKKGLGVAEAEGVFHL